MHRPSVALLTLLLSGVVIAPPIAMAIAEFTKSFKYKPSQPTLASASTLVLKPDRGYVAFVLTLCAVLAILVIICFVSLVGTQEQSEGEFFVIMMSVIVLYVLSL
jgi:hypothetical protein